MSCCSTLGTRILLFWFASLLPPTNSDDIEYYELLGVTKSASKEEIRKAYKKKSLFLHPDKILQRGGNPDDHRQEYQNIQEAHTVLSDDKNRQKYNLVNCSVTRYRFLTDEGALAGAYENLVKASCEKKSRLVLLLAIFLGFILLQPILICVKLNQTFGGGGPLQNTDWVLIFIPWFIFHGFYIIALCLAVVLTGCNLTLACKFFENVGWLTGLVLLTLRWDLTIELDYVVVFIPVYVAMVLRWIGEAITMIQLRNDISRMISIEKLEEKVGKPYEDFTEEEHEEIAREFIIVHIPPGFEVVNDDDDDIVQASSEYQLAASAYYGAFLNIVNGIIFGIPLVTLIVLKVDKHFVGSWWIVFIPVWIYIGFQLIKGCYVCCCISSSEEVIKMELNNAGDEETGGEVQQGGKPEKVESSFVEVGSSMNYFKQGESEEKQDFKQAEGEEKQDNLDGKSEVQSDNIDSGKSSSDVNTNSTSPNLDDVVVLEETIIDNQNEDGENVERADGAAEFTEEDFQNFQETYQQAERVAMEEQQKGCSSVCTALFQLTIMCLIVGKLEVDYPADDSWGFNAIWIIFPFLLIAGCLLCCWACLIYGAGQQGLDNLVDRMAGKEEDENDENHEDAESVEPPIVLTPSPPGVVTSAAVTSNNGDSKPQQVQSDVAGYDDDID
mmetsp:Transcript_32662/g.49226  ORF Transcript_32662/g.49226 Transcript_32662/m.49226 type:complete len:668 (+) Transcript_32662:41-2044(+)